MAGPSFSNYPFPFGYLAKLLLQLDIQSKLFIKLCRTEKKNTRKSIDFLAFLISLESIYTRIVHRIIVNTIVVTPCSKVAAVCALYASVTFMPLNCVMTQKKLSFTWLTVIAPAP